MGKGMETEPRKSQNPTNPINPINLVILRHGPRVDGWTDGVSDGLMDG